MKHRLFVAGATALSLAFSVGQSSAADIAPVEEPLYDWTGFYIGIGGGYRWLDVDLGSRLCEDLDCDLLDNEGDFDLSRDGFFGTIQGGFDWQVAPSFVIGLLASYDVGENLGDDRFRDLEGIGPFDEPGEGLASDTDFNDVFTVAARMGFVWDRALLYGLVGWSWANFEAEISAICDTVCDDAEFDRDGSVDGLTFGGGIEYLWTENVSTRIEYRHIEFSELNVDGEFDNFEVDIENDLSMDSIRGTIDFRF